MKHTRHILSLLLAATLAAGASAQDKDPGKELGKDLFTAPSKPGGTPHAPGHGSPKGPQVDPKVAACKNEITNVRGDIKNLVMFNKSKMDAAERTKFAEIDKANDANYAAVQKDGLTVAECNDALRKFQEERVMVRKMIADVKPK
jgi:hypothetical protein